MPRPVMTGLAEILGAWGTADAPLFRGLAGAMRRAIARGDLLPDTRLPPERDLARDLAVSRTTVIAALDLLKDEGWLESRQGSGTWVRRRNGSSETRFDDPITSLRGNASLRDAQIATMIDLATATTTPAEDVVRAIAGVSARDARRLVGGTSYAPSGLPELRAAIAAHLSGIGVPTAPEEVLVTTGTQQALTLLAAQLLVPTDTFLVENPTSPGALDAFRATGARPRWVVLGDEGLSLDALDDLVRLAAPRVLYLIPTNQNPTGVTLGAEMRRRLAELADRSQTWLLEDLSHSWVRFSDVECRPIAAESTEDQVIVVDSLSKPFWSGLRIGWIRAKEVLIRRLGQAKALADLGTPLLSQLVAARLLPQAPVVMASRNLELRERLRLAEELLPTYLPGWEWAQPDGGLTLWLRMPEGSARGFSQVALRYGVTIVPGPLLSIDERFDDHVRITFSVSKDDLEVGISRLGQAWQAYRGMGEAALAPTIVP